MPELRWEEEVVWRLTEAGVRPSVVRRVRAELHDHAESLRDAARESAPGRSSADVERFVRQQLGTPGQLAEVYVSEPRNLSYARRWPRIVFGLLPFLSFQACLVGFVAMVVGGASLIETIWDVDLAHVKYGWLHRTLSGAFWAAPYVAPVLLLVAYRALARRRRAPWDVVLVTAGVLAMAACLTSLEFAGPGVGPEGRFSVGISLGATWPRLFAGMVVAAAAMGVARRWRRKPRKVA